jgi:hypothetical protein
MTTTLSDMAAAVGAPKEPAKPVKENSAERLIASDAARREAERLDRRKHIRLQIKQREALMQQVEDAESQLRLLDVRADQAAAVHAEKTAPIQQSLAGATGTKRAALLLKLSDANFELEQSLAVVERCREPLLKQHRELRSEAASLPASNALAHHGSPSTLAEMFAARIRLKHASSRVEAATDQLSFLEPQLDEARRTKYPVSEFGWEKPGRGPQVNFELIASLGRRVREWKCEVTHASAEQFSAMTAIDELTRDMIAE